ncbi:fatty acid desaturase [Roseivirga sp. BDSF3-8]|uniref:fatty acid desaturase family protein n=1 Tax=Roseivirga sp. BDSF3-8 TaxID=3241598 RepID=UPI0035325418
MKLQFLEGNNSDFYNELTHKVDKYFKENKLSRYADTGMVLKTIFITVTYLAMYGLLITSSFNAFTGILYCVIMGLMHPLFFINIGHDALHHTYSKKKSVNRFLAYFLNFAGLNAYINRILHLKVHHLFTSVEGYDIIIEEYSVLRLSENQPYEKMHKYQVYYAPLIYSLFSIFLIFSIDFVLFKRSRMGNSPIEHSKGEMAKLYLQKLSYLFFMLVLPLMVVNVAWYWVVMGFFLVHMISGLALAMVGVLNHQINESVFPQPNEDGYITNSRKNHELEATIDFAPYSKLALWYFGGFNTHTAHHLFPNLCHTHYIPVTRMIEETVKDYGLTYRKHSLAGAIKSHFAYLKRLSKPPKAVKVS